MDAIHFPRLNDSYRSRKPHGRPYYSPSDQALDEWDRLAAGGFFCDESALDLLGWHQEFVTWITRQKPILGYLNDDMIRGRSVAVTVPSRTTRFSMVPMSRKARDIYDGEGPVALFRKANLQFLGPLSEERAIVEIGLMAARHRARWAMKRVHDICGDSLPMPLEFMADLEIEIAARAPYLRDAS